MKTAKVNGGCGQSVQHPALVAIDDVDGHPKPHSPSCTLVFGRGCPIPYQHIVDGWNGT